METKEKNLEIYNKLKEVPEQAKKPITAGRLKGFTDINPMWRIKIMTMTFGPVGVGWKYEIVRLWTESCGEEIRAFCQLNLYVLVNGKWSDAIIGIGGSSFASKEKSGVYVNDECYKMALTDALGVAMKSLGVAADVYYAKDNTKYAADTNNVPTLDEAIGALEKVQTQEEYKGIWNKYAIWYGSNKDFYTKAQEVVNNLTQKS